MKELYIDFDGVILDTIKVLYEYLDNEGIDPKSTDEKEEKRRRVFIEKLDWNNIVNTTPQINDSIECIRKIINSKKFVVSILTHVNSLNEAIAKVNYIRNYFKDITIIPVPKKISKTKMVHTDGTILIDDYSGNLMEWEDEGGIGIRFSPTLDSKGFKVIDHLDQILDMEI